ncbi:unnamed protein product [Cladocopium goreaui]|uniref:SET domain-containing protein n=1 Tax=Cladocopium goreaui TaxID=2562237 RepID=A0A9P1D1Q4_9DINO|nr:unnamed protein product [Cladocopium goreaui]
MAEASTAAFLVPVVVQDAPQYGEGHRGVFAAARIPRGTQIWTMTDMVEMVHHSEVRQRLQAMTREDAAVFVRQSCVMPENLERLFVNPRDAGRFINHSSSPNLGFEGALRDISEGEEIVMDYNQHGDPEWYRELCAEYRVLTERQVAALAPTEPLRTQPQKCVWVGV